MSLFGALMGDMEDDPIFGSHMRQMRQMSNMMHSMFSDPFGMMGGGPLSIMGRDHGTSLMPFMPQMPSLTRILPGGLDGHMGTGGSFHSSTYVMSSGPHGKPQVISSTSSTKIGPNGVKETHKTLQDSRTGTKKMSIGHHIGERAHVIEREQNVYSGDAEEHQEFINLDEEEAEEFDREFQTKVGVYASRAPRGALPPSRVTPPQLALPAPPTYNASSNKASASHKPSARKPIRTTSSPLTGASSRGVARETYGGSRPQAPRQRPNQRRH